MVVSEERMAALEARTRRLEARVAQLDGLEAASTAPPRGPRATSARCRARPAPSPRPRPARARPPRRGSRSAVAALPRRPLGPRRRGAAAPRPRPAWEDLVGGRVLGWVGGARRARRHPLLPRHRGLARLDRRAGARAHGRRRLRCCCSRPARGCTSGAAATRRRSPPRPPASPGCSRPRSSPARSTSSLPALAALVPRARHRRRGDGARAALRARPGSAGSGSSARSPRPRSSAPPATGDRASR